ncbi:MAG: efflux RND transporter permease subunit [Gammaproteobacteria bacterium]|nr:MAG: efflux RND transporter permease subunit [Gammaproteobacteria bacterium]
MKGIVSWFVHNKVAANLLMVIILIVGYFSLPQIRKEIMPNYSFDTISINMPYLGAAPIEIEKGICAKIEAAISDIDGIENITSLAAENFGLITVDVDYDYKARDLVEQIKDRVDAISTFPTDAGRPIVQVNAIKTGVAKMMISGNAEERTLKNLAEKIRQQLVDMPQISQVEITDSRSNEVIIEVSHELLDRYALSFAEVVNAVRISSIDLPGGVIKTRGGDISVRTESQINGVNEFEDIALRAASDGSRITVGDVAKVIDGFKGNARTEFNGKPAVSLSVYRVGNENVTDISDAMKAYITNPPIYIPEGITLTMWQDTAGILKSCLQLLVSNAFSGLILLFLILLLFLRTNLAFWVSMGIPVSFMGTFALLPYFDGSINMISLFAFILVLGVVVDDAIVIGESIFSKIQKGVTGAKAAIEGTLEVAKPVIFATLTTVVAFSPLLFFSGIKGRMISIIPVVVIITLIVSLIESILILPSHLSDLKELKPSKRKWLNSIRDFFSIFLNRVIEMFYSPMLKIALKRRGVVLAFFIGLFIICSGLIEGGYLGSGKDIEMEAEMISAQIAYPQGGTIDDTAKGIKQLEHAVQTIKKRLNEKYHFEQIKGVITSIGMGVMDNVGIVSLELVPSEQRSLSAKEISEMWRKEAGEIDGALKIAFSATMRDTGPAISLELSGQDIGQLKVAADELKKLLAEFDGVYNIADSYEFGKPEIGIKIKPFARDIGLTELELSRQVREAFYGVVAHKIQRGINDVSVFVQYPQKDRSSVWDLENMLIKLPDGSSVPLINIADINYGKAPFLIKRVNSKRVILVTAYLDDQVTPPNVVNIELFKRFFMNLPQNHPGVSWRITGFQQSEQEFKQALGRGFAAAILVMYILMAVLFKSYLQPLMVMSAIPFGVIGAIIGHLVMGVDITPWTFVGIIAVSGVVVNDNLVMIDYINRAREEGKDLMNAITMAGVERFRPILLTSLTTFVGLVPLMYENSWQAQFLIPMAISLAYGVVFATFLTLFLVPCLYHMLDDFINWRNAKKNSKKKIDDAETNLDDVYNHGYAHGLEGKPNKCPYKSEVVIAGWEAGWGDGYEEYLKRKGEK